eukprot:g2478.t1
MASKDEKDTSVESSEESPERKKLKSESSWKNQRKKDQKDFPLTFGDRVRVKKCSDQFGSFVRVKAREDGQYDILMTLDGKEVAHTVKNTKTCLPCIPGHWRGSCGKKREDGISVGLRNFLHQYKCFGNPLNQVQVCAINTIVQMLFSCEEFRHTVLSLSEEKMNAALAQATENDGAGATKTDPLQAKKVRVLRELYDLFARMHFSKRKAVDTTPFAYALAITLEAMRNEDPTFDRLREFNIGTQIDAEEILPVLCEKIISPALKTIEVEKDFVDSLFSFMVKTKGATADVKTSAVFLEFSIDDELRDGESQRLKYIRSGRPREQESNLDNSSDVFDPKLFRTGFLKSRSMYHAFDAKDQQFSKAPEKYLQIVMNRSNLAVRRLRIEPELFLDDYVLSEDGASKTPGSDRDATLRRFEGELQDLERQIEAIRSDKKRLDTIRALGNGSEAKFGLDTVQGEAYEKFESFKKNAREVHECFVCTLKKLLKKHQAKRKEIETFMRNEGSEYHYRLHCVIIHQVNPGHYYAYTKKRGGDQWQKCNDTSCNDVSLDEVLSDANGTSGNTCARMCIYRRVLQDNRSDSDTASKSTESSTRINESSRQRVEWEDEVLCHCAENDDGNQYVYREKPDGGGRPIPDGGGCPIYNGNGASKTTDSSGRGTLSDTNDFFALLTFCNEHYFQAAYTTRNGVEIKQTSPFLLSFEKVLRLSHERPLLYHEYFESKELHTRQVYWPDEKDASMRHWFSQNAFLGPRQGSIYGTYLHLRDGSNVQDQTRIDKFYDSMEKVIKISKDMVEVLVQFVPLTVRILIGNEELKFRAFNALSSSKWGNQESARAFIESINMFLKELGYPVKIVPPTALTSHATASPDRHSHQRE